MKYLKALFYFVTGLAYRFISKTHPAWLVFVVMFATASVTPLFVSDAPHSTPRSIAVVVFLFMPLVTFAYFYKETKEAPSGLGLKKKFQYVMGQGRSWFFFTSLLLFHVGLSLSFAALVYAVSFRGVAFVEGILIIGIYYIFLQALAFLAILALETFVPPLFNACARFCVRQYRDGRKLVRKSSGQE